MIDPLDPSKYREIVRQALDEDVGYGDVTTAATVSATQLAHGIFLAKADCVVAGLEVAFEAIRQVHSQASGSGSPLSLEIRQPDGARCAAGEVIADVIGSASALLTAERTALNFLQRLSGIATVTRRFVDAAGGRLIVLDTRKTTPNLRALEKYAVRAGGGSNHRSGLFDAVLIKDNHIRLAGGVRAAVERMRHARPGWPIEIEAQSLDQVDEALAVGAEKILLDNLSPDAVREAVRRTRGRALTEISGGVTLERMAELASTGADFVSIGALTHSAPAVDISFELEPL
ncbi:MAG TPA: carboxylating nicotinate-nucleotide diphosphorylase [Vicinamibacterales bacterium]|nr:carboxylating nicotinate-nucleotide diphosphorylase [Vicinamibacterales bacterium]